MNPVDPGRNDAANLLAQPGPVTGQDAGRDAEVVIELGFDNVRRSLSATAARGLRFVPQFDEPPIGVAGFVAEDAQ